MGALARSGEFLLFFFALIIALRSGGERKSPLQET